MSCADWLGDEPLGHGCLRCRPARRSCLGMLPRSDFDGPHRYGHRRGRLPKVIVPEPLAAIEPPPPPAAPARLERMEVDCAALDALLADTNRVVERVQRLLTSR